jgi:DNA-binding SARP family transcriptional activator
MPCLELFLLGPPYLQREGLHIHIGRKRVLGLMAYLTISGKIHDRNDLAWLFWPNKDEDQANIELRRALSILGQLWGWEHLEITRETVHLTPMCTPWVDAIEFQQKISAWKRHAHSPNQICRECLSTLSGALQLYCDDFMTGFSLAGAPDFEAWQESQCRNLHDDLIHAIEWMARQHSLSGEWQNAIALVQRQISLDPLNESAHLHLMRLYSRSGQRSSALHQFKVCERLLEAELGVPPHRETIQVFESISNAS